MTPGSLLLGNAGQCFECGHEHAEGDRCVSFSYTRDCFEQLMADAGHKRRRFAVPRVPALRALAPVVARTAATLVTDRHDCWEELSVRVADAAAGLATGSRPHYRAPRNAEARVTRCVRAIDERPESTLTLDSLAHETGLSRYHFLRTFVRLTGITPHQYVLRARLRHAAIRLSVGRTRVLDIAFDCGFGDLSNFNRAFRAEFGASPRSFQVRRA
jgi:AraC-like DNA-binding protein